MEDLLENISRNSNPKDNFYIVVGGNKSRLKTLFSSPMKGKNYELALVGVSTYQQGGIHVQCTAEWVSQNF